MPASSIRDPAESDDPIGDDAMSPVQGAGASLSRPGADQAGRGSARSIAASAFAASGSGRARARLARPNSPRRSTTSARAPAIWEVILTGGDPLTLSPRRIAEATPALAAIPHVKVLRWHTRLPVAEPERVTRAMARALVADGKTTVVAVHANHPRELTDAARAACRRLSGRGSNAGQPERASERRQRRSGDARST